MCTKLFNLVLYNQTTWFYLPKYIILFLTQFCSPRVPGSAHPLIIDQGTNSSICHELGHSRQTTDYSVNLVICYTFFQKFVMYCLIVVSSKVPSTLQ